MSLNLDEDQQMRWAFEELMHTNDRSVVRDGDKYHYKEVQSMWVAFKVGWIKGKEFKNG